MSEAAVTKLVGWTAPWPRWRPGGGLVDGCCSDTEHKAERHELISGDYLFLEARPALDGVIDPGSRQR